MLSFGTVSDRPALKPAYLILGSDRPKVRRAVERLRRRVEEEAGSDLNVVIFDAEVDPVDAVLEAASMPGLTFGTRLLLVRNGQRWAAKARQALAAYVRDPMPDTCLAIEEEPPKTRKPKADDVLRKAIAEAGEVLVYDLPKKYEMTGWVRERARAHGLSMNVAAARRLLERCGDDPQHGERLEREIEKLALYCGAGEASVEDIDAVTTADDEASIFELMDAVDDRDPGRALQLLERVYLAGEDPNKVLFMLNRHLQAIAEVTRLGRADAATVEKQLNVHPRWRAEKLVKQASRYDDRRLGQARKALATAETGLRGRAPATLGSEGGVDRGDQFVLELALMRLLA
jgi:DNA polymerase-3 subunit delta